MHFIEYLLSDDDRRLLAEAGAVYTEERIGTRTCCRHGISFEYEWQEVILDTLGLFRRHGGNHGYVTNPATGDLHVPYMDDISIFEPPTPESPIQIVTDNLRGFALERLNAVAKLAYPELGLLMVMTNIARRTANSRHFGRLTIHPNLVPEGLEAHEVYQDLEGLSRFLNVRGQTRDYTVVRADNGRYLALFKGDSTGGNLWLLFDPCVEAAKDLFGFVLHTLSRLLHPELGEPETVESYRNKAAQRQFLALVAKQVEEEIKSLPDQLNASAAQVATAQDTLARAMRTQRLAKARVDAATDDPRELARQITRQMEQSFENLLNSPDFESITFEGDVLKARTRPIDITFDGKVYSFGRYIITCHEDRIRISGMERPGADYCHPHISGGNACFGNMAEAFAALLAKGDFANLLPLIVNYLEDGYTPSDSYLDIEQFNVPVRSISTSREESYA